MIRKPQNLNRPYQPQRQRRLIKTDRVQAADLAKFAGRFFCDDCSHYDAKSRLCTIGYVAQHTRQQQMALFCLTGMMAFCRFLEID